jgi:FtsP/CotA-like multicopper oxidase with cupredoxin domain
MSLTNEKSDENLSRREILKGAVATAVASLLSSRETLAAGSSGPGNGPTSPPTTPFLDSLPIPGIKEAVTSLNPSPPDNGEAGVGEVGRVAHQRWKDFPPAVFYELHVKEKPGHLFHSELQRQTVWGYDGLYPGPTFIARISKPVLVRIYNELPENHTGFGSPEICTHLHGAHDASESDGFPSDWYSRNKAGPTLTRPGQYKDHHYPNIYAGYDESPRTLGDPREGQGTMWYHDHRMDFTAPNVYKGLAGFYLVFDDIDSGNENDNKDTNPKALKLPSGVGIYDIPLVFQDKQFDSSGMLVYDQFDPEGAIGDKFCVNGVIQPFFNVQPRKYRFRLLNGSVARFYEFFLVLKQANGNLVDQTFTYIANDGNLLPAPIRDMKSVRLGMAERADIVIDFTPYAGSQLFLVNRMEQTDSRGPTGKILQPGIQILRFDVGTQPVADPSVVPPTLRALPELDLAKVVKSRRWEFDRSGGGWTVNNQFFDFETVSASPKRGTAEIWTLKNGGGGWWHPIHIHLEDGRILSRNGKPPPPHEIGRKDVYVLMPGEELQVLLHFRDFRGKYVMHCHNTAHEDHAMMVRWDVVP